MQIQLTTHMYICTYVNLYVFVYVCTYNNQFRETKFFMVCTSSSRMWLLLLLLLFGCQNNIFVCACVCVFAQSEIIWVGEIVNKNNQSSFCYVLPTYHTCIIWKILFPYPHEYFILPAAEFVFLIPSDSLLSQSAVVPCRAHRVWMNVP